MSIFTKIKNIFRREKPPELPPTEELPEEPVEEVKEGSEVRSAEISNLRIKLDLILTELDNIKTQNRMIDEKLKTIEKIIVEKRSHYF